MAICGDGIQDPDELCDDGNQLAGDGCSPECLPSGMPVDCVDLLVQDNPDDWDTVADLVPLADGTFIAAGQRDAMTDRRGWVGRFEPSGAQRWFVDATTLDVNIDNIAGLAGDEQAGIWALATGSSLRNALVIQFDRDGNVVSTAGVQSEFSTSLYVWDIEVTTSGVWLAGGVWIAQAQMDGWLGLYSPTSDVMQDVLREDHLGYDDGIHAVARDGEGVAVAATVSTSSNHDGDIILMPETDVLVIWLDPQGNELRRAMVGPSADPEFVRYASLLAADEFGRWFVGGTLSPFDFVTQQNQGWVVQIGGDWTWTNPASGLAHMMGIDEGIVVAANPVITAGSGAPYHQGWLAEFAWDGSARWDFGADQDGLANYKDYRHSVLARDSGGHIRTAGSAWAHGELSKVRSCLITR